MFAKLSVDGASDTAGATIALIVNVTAFDVPPPGAGLATVTGTAAAVAMSAAAIAALSCVALMKVVTSALPLKLATELFTKFEPLMVKVNAPDPATAVAGSSAVIAGTGLFAAETVKVTAFEAPPPGVGLATVTGSDPAVATSVARMAAISLVALTKVVVLAIPLKLTTELLMKLDPLTVNVSAPDPATTVAGSSVVMAGTGLLAVMVSVAAFEVPPPGVGLVTVTFAVPAVLISVARIDAVS